MESCCTKTAPRSRKIKLHERCHKWQLEVEGERLYKSEELPPFCDCLKGIAAGAVNAFFKATVYQLGALSTLSRHHRRPQPDVWSVLGKREKLLTPLLYNLSNASPVTVVGAATTADEGEDAIEDKAKPTFRVQGLANEVIDENTKMMFIFMPMNTLFNQPDSACTASDLTSEVFAPVGTGGKRDVAQTPPRSRRESVEPADRIEAMRRQILEEDAEERRRVEEKSRNIALRETLLDQRGDELDKLEAALRLREEALEEKERNLDKRLRNLAENEAAAKQLQKELENRRTQMKEIETQQAATKEQQAKSKEEIQRDQEKIKKRQAEQDARQKEMDKLEAEQGAREQQINDLKSLLNNMENGLKKEKAEQEKIKEVLEKEMAGLKDREQKTSALEEHLGKWEKTLKDREARLDAREQQLQEIESRLKKEEERLKKYDLDLQAKETALSARDAAITTKEAKLKQKEEELERLATELAKKKASLDQMEKELNSKEQMLKEKEAMLIECEEMMKQREEAMNQREALLIEKEAKFAERDRVIKQRENDLDSRESKIKELEVALQKKEEELQNLENQLLGKEKQLQEKQDQLTQFEASLKERESKAEETMRAALEKLAQNKELEEMLKRKEEDLYNLEKSLQELEDKNKTEQKMIAERERALQELEDMLKDWEKRQREEEERLKKELGRLTKLGQELSQRENNLNVEENRLKEMKESLERDGKRLKEQENNLKNQEQKLKEQEDKLKHMDQDLKTREGKLREEEKKLMEEQKMLRQDQDKLQQNQLKLKQEQDKLQADKDGLQQAQDQLAAQHKEMLTAAQRPPPSPKKVTPPPPPVPSVPPIPPVPPVPPVPPIARTDSTRQIFDTLDKVEDMTRTTHRGVGSDTVLATREEKREQRRKEKMRARGPSPNYPATKGKVDSQDGNKPLERSDAAEGKDGKADRDPESSLYGTQQKNEEAQLISRTLSGSKEDWASPGGIVLPGTIIPGTEKIKAQKGKETSKGHKVPISVPTLISKSETGKKEVIKARSVSPTHHDDEIASVLTEDDVLMVSSYKSKQSTVVETYDIRYMREEIYDDKESMIAYGRPAIGQGLRKSHESESFVLSAEEGGRSSGSSRSSSRSPSRLRQRYPYKSFSQKSTQSTQADEEYSSKKTAKDSDDDNVPPSGAKKIVSFHDNKTEMDHSHSRSPPPTNQKRHKSPHITFTEKSSKPMDLNLSQDYGTQFVDGVKRMLSLDTSVYLTESGFDAAQGLSSSVDEIMEVKKTVCDFGVKTRTASPTVTNVNEIPSSLSLKVESKCTTPNKMAQQTIISRPCAAVKTESNVKRSVSLSPIRKPVFNVRSQSLIHKAFVEQKAESSHKLNLTARQQIKNTSISLISGISSNRLSRSTRRIKVNRLNVMQNLKNVQPQIAESACPLIQEKLNPEDVQRLNSPTTQMEASGPVWKKCCPEPRQKLRSPSLYLQTTSPVPKNMGPKAKHKSRSPSPQMKTSGPMEKNVCPKVSHKSRSSSPLMETASPVQKKVRPEANYKSRSPSLMMETTSLMQKNVCSAARQKSKSPSPHLPATSPVQKNACPEVRQKSKNTSPSVETTSQVHKNECPPKRHNLRSPSPKNAVSKEEIMCPVIIQKHKSAIVNSSLNPSQETMNISAFSLRTSPKNKDMKPDSLQTLSSGSVKLSSQPNTKTPSQDLDQEVNSLSSSHPFSNVQDNKCLSPVLPQFQASLSQSVIETKIEQKQTSVPVFEAAEIKSANLLSPLHVILSPHLFTLSPVRMLSPLMELNTGIFSVFRDSSTKLDSSVDSNESSPVKSLMKDESTGSKSTFAGSSPKLSLLEIAEEIEGSEDSEDKYASGTVELEDFKPKLEEVESWEKDVSVSHLINESTKGIKYEKRSSIDITVDSSVDFLPQVHNHKAKDYECSMIVTQQKEKTKADQIVEAFRRRKRWDKPDEEYSLERTDNISSKSSSESEISYSSHISIDCVSPKIAMILPSLLETAPSQEFITMSSDHLIVESSKSEEFSENSQEVKTAPSVSGWSVISFGKTLKSPVNGNQQLVLLESSDVDYVSSNSKKYINTAEIMTHDSSMQPPSWHLTKDKNGIPDSNLNLQLPFAEALSTLSPMTESKQRHKKSPFSISQSSSVENGRMRVAATSPAKSQPAASSIHLKPVCISPTLSMRRLESEVFGQEAEISQRTTSWPSGSMPRAESVKSPSSKISKSPIKSKQSSPVFSIRSKARSLLKSPQSTAKTSSATASEILVGNISKAQSTLSPAVTHMLEKKAQVPNLATLQSVSPQQTSPGGSDQHTFPTVVKSTSPSPSVWSHRSRSSGSRSRDHTPNNKIECPLDLVLQLAGEVNGKMTLDTAVTSDSAITIQPAPILLSNSILSDEHFEVAPKLESITYTIPEKCPPNIKSCQESSPRITKSRYPSPVMCHSPLPLETTFPGDFIQAAPVNFKEELSCTVGKLQNKANAQIPLPINCQSPSKPESLLSPVHSTAELKVNVRHKPDRSPAGNKNILTTTSSSSTRSPCSQLQSVVALSQFQDKSLAGLLANQRKKACSPMPIPQASSAKSVMTQLQSKGQRFVEDPAKLHASSTPLAYSMPSPQPPTCLGNASNPLLSPEIGRHAVFEVSSQPSRANKHSVSPSNHLFNAALQSNGSTGLKSMLDKQRKASRTKMVIKEEPVQVASNKGRKVALEHVTTSVGEVRVDRKGKPPSSVVTIIQKKVRYTKEAIRDKKSLPIQPVHDAPTIASRVEPLAIYNHSIQESKVVSQGSVFAPSRVSPDLSSLANAVLSEAEARIAEKNKKIPQVPTNVSSQLKNKQSVSDQQMREREMLIRKRLNAKKTKELSKNGMPVKCETSYENRSHIYGNDIAKSNLDQSALTLLKPLTLQQQTKGFSPKIASVSPFIKQRALDGQTDPLKSDSSEFTNICNSSPIRRNKASERYQAYPRTSPRNSPQAATDGNNIPQAFSPQMQTFRHQQGLVGDSVELPHLLQSQERREEEPMDHDQGPGPEVLQTLNSCTPSHRPKKNRRVSWEDRPEGNPGSDNSKNQNAYYSSGESCLEIIDSKGVLDIHSFSAGDDAQSHILKIEKEISEKIERETNAGDLAHGDAGAVHLTLMNVAQDPRADVLTKHVRNHEELVLEQHSGQGNIWHTISNTNKLQADVDGGSIAVRLSKEQRGVEHKQFNQSYLQKEESHCKTFATISNAAATTIAHKNSSYKQYMQSQPGKHAMIKEERVQSKEYIFKRNPRTAYFPEQKLQKECTTRKLGPSPVSKTYRWPNLPGGDENTNCPDSQTSLVVDSIFGHCQDDTNDCSMLYIRQAELQNKSPCTESGANEWVRYSHYQSDNYNTNGSANYSDDEGTSVICSPVRNIGNNDCTFFSPYPVIRESAVAGRCELVSLQHEDNVCSAVCNCGLSISSRQGKSSLCKAPRCCDDKSIKSLYLSVPPENQQIINKRHRRHSNHPVAEIRYREHKHKHCGNKNNSGDVQPKSSPNLKQVVLDNDPSAYRSVVEASACGGGDQPETAGTKHHEHSDKISLTKKSTQQVRPKSADFRGHRNENRACARQGKTRHTYLDASAQEPSDNCFLIQSVLPPESLNKKYNFDKIYSKDESFCDLTLCTPKKCCTHECTCSDTPEDFCDCAEEFCHGATSQACMYMEDEDSVCHECACLRKLAAMPLKDEGEISGAGSQLWHVKHADAEHLEAGYRLQIEKSESCESYEPEEGTEYSPQRSVPSAYSDECQCSFACSAGRGDGDVLPTSRKEQATDFNVSKCETRPYQKRRVLGHWHGHAEKHKFSENSPVDPSENSMTDKQDDPSLCTHCQHLHLNDDTDILSKQHDHQQHECNCHLAVAADGEPTNSNSLSQISQLLSVTQSMVQAYGYNPLTESPFTARGYPSLPEDLPTLDHISVPYIKRKALVFLRTDKDELVEVGRGTYGCVYLAQATTRKGSTKVVVKDFFTDSTSCDLIIHEARMLCYLQDTGVIPHFYGLLKHNSSGNDFSLIMQYFAQGRTLHMALVNKEQLAPDVWQDVAWQLAHGLLFIHQRHVLLNDLKGDNVLIDLRRERKVIKYIDLGMATYRKGLNFHLPEDQMTKFNFLSPEVRGGAYTSPMSDVYSLGYLMEQINRLACLPLLATLCRQCIEDHPGRRPPLTAILEDLQRWDYMGRDPKIQPGFSGSSSHSQPGAVAECYAYEWRHNQIDASPPSL